MIFTAQQIIVTITAFNLLIREAASDSFRSSGKMTSGKSSLLRANHFVNKLEKGRGFDSLSPEILGELLTFLHVSSPSHLFYLVCDNTFCDADEALQENSRIFMQYTLVKLTSDQKVLERILTDTAIKVNTNRRHFLILCNNENIKDIFNMVSSRNLESPSIWWIVIAFSSDATDLLQSVLREGSQAVVIQQDSQNTFKFLVSKIDHNGLISFLDVGRYKKLQDRSEVHLSESLFKEHDITYSNFEGRQLTVTAISNNPFIVMERQSNAQLVPVSGFEKTILDSISHTLNFTYQMMTPRDRKWGGPTENGSVVGMIGDVYRREAHFAISEITITGSREGVIDFTYPYYIESLTLTSRTPREKNKTFAAFSPFTSMVWLCIAISVVAIGLVIVLEAFIMKSHRTEGLLKPSSFQDTFFNMFRSLVKQENLLATTFWPHNLTFIYWYIFAFIVSVLYSGMLIAALVIPSFDKPINGLVDLPLAVKEGFTLVVTADSSNEYIFKSAKSGIYKDTWKLFDQGERSKSFIPKADYSFQGILDDKLVLVNGQLSSRYLSMDRGIHRYYFARDTFAPQYYGIACFPGSPFVSVFSKALSYMTEGGLINQWVNIEFQKVARFNVADGQSGPRPFSISQLQAAFYVFLIGAITASLTFIFETCIGRI